jgi:hypothetical protein
MLHMLQVQNVSSVPDVYCKRFDLNVCICFTHMLQQHVLYVSSVSDVRCKFYLDVACYNYHVASVYSKCFICFNRMLQLIHLSVAKVDLNV